MEGKEVSGGTPQELSGLMLRPRDPSPCTPPVWLPSPPSPRYQVLQEKYALVAALEGEERSEELDKALALVRARRLRVHPLPLPLCRHSGSLASLSGVGLLPVPLSLPLPGAHCPSCPDMGRDLALHPNSEQRGGGS